MSDTAPTWLTLLGLAAPVVFGSFRLFLRYDMNDRAFVQVCRRLLQEGRTDRFEQLLDVFPKPPLLIGVLRVAWRRRHEPEPVTFDAARGYRDAQAPPSYAARMKGPLQPVVRAAREAAWGAFTLTIPGLVAPVVVYVLSGSPSDPNGPWIAAIVLALLSVAAGSKARRITASVDRGLDALLPLLEPANPEQTVSS